MYGLKFIFNVAWSVTNSKEHNQHILHSITAVYG